MKKIKSIFGVFIITQLLISCGEVTTVDLVPKSKEIAGDFVKNIEISSDKVTLSIEKDLGSNKLIANIEFKGILPCPGCTYERVNLNLLDEKGMSLGTIKFDRSEGDQIDKLDKLIQNGSGKTMFKFTGGRIGDKLNDESMKKIIQNCKSFSVESKALKIPTAGELLIGKEKFGGLIVSADEKGEHGLVISLEDLSTESDWSAAKQICSAYTADGTTGWRLPTKSEMEQIYSNLRGKKIKNDLEDAYYWTETIYNHNFGTTWPYSFDYSRGESSHNYSMVKKFHVRAVRTF
jgi:hypothetical protein